MSKLKSTYYCQECGAQYSKWQGQCNKCNSWNSISEELIETSKKNLWDHTKSDLSSSSSVPKSIDNIKIKDEYRIKTKDNEFNRVLGGGIVPGSITLLGGEPGIGKSTLFLQISLMINQRVLYVSGEESENQIKIRANRISYTNKDCLIYAENKLENIFSQAEKIKPNLIIIDSIQTLITNSVDSLQGSITQLKTCTAELINFGKKTSIPVMLIGHINKDGNIAGPKVLEHMVDTVLQFEGDRNHLYRILRVKKNRFGSTNEIGIYEMVTQGLKEIINPSEILIGKSDQKLSGTAICASVEGSRPFLIEVQALVSTAVYGTPQRSTTGINSKRLNMLLAVLEKRAGFHLGSKDIFLNITGGLKVEDTGNDLAIISAIMSSNNDIKIPEDYCFAAEVGLSGEIRPVSRIDQRIKEAEKLGFSKIFVSKYCDVISAKKIEVIYLTRIEDLIDHIS
jgi:DNA repair protein RadA/Sms|tara:strand:- start:4041 stop:5399 length:1359 start_codon:yes stop_codon:yes gene_type:complete